MSTRKSAIDNFIKEASNSIRETGHIGRVTNENGGLLLEGNHLIESDELYQIISTAFKNAIIN